MQAVQKHDPKQKGEEKGEKEKIRALQSKLSLSKSKHFSVKQTGYSLPVKTVTTFLSL